MAAVANVVDNNVVNDVYERMIVDFFCYTQKVDRMLLRDVVITTVRRWKETKREQKALLNVSGNRQYHVSIDSNGNMVLNTHKMKISMKYRYVLIALEMLRRIEVDELHRDICLSRLCSLLKINVDGLEFVC